MARSPCRPIHAARNSISAANATSPSPSIQSPPAIRTARIRRAISPSPPNASNSPQVIKLTGIAFGTVPSPTTTSTPIPVNKSVLSTALFVANGGNYVTVYPLGANGDVAPIASIDGGATGLSGPASIALDPRGNIYVLNSEGKPSPFGTITVYPPGSNGNVDPIATIGGPNTGLKSSKAIAVDSAGRIYAASLQSTFGCDANITVFHALSDGNVNPVATICGDDTHVANPYGVAVDSSRNIYTTSLGGGGQREQRRNPRLRSWQQRRFTAAQNNRRSQHRPHVTGRHCPGLPRKRLCDATTTSAAVTAVSAPSECSPPAPTATSSLSTPSMDQLRATSLT